jgi:predicted ester cyclase
MSDIDPRDLYERYIEGLNAHEFERIEEFVHETIVLQSEPGSRAALVAKLKGIVDAVPDFHWATQELVVDGSRLSARLVNTGTPAKEWLGVEPTGASFKVVEYAVYQVRDGRFEHMAAIHDAEAVRRQLGGRALGAPLPPSGGAGEWRAERVHRQVDGRRRPLRRRSHGTAHSRHRRVVRHRPRDRPRVGRPRRQRRRRGP